MNKSTILKKVLMLHALYNKGLIKTLTQHEVHPDCTPGSRERYLYFTLPPCLNFQRSSPAMWASALKTWDDPTTRYLFFPEQTTKKSFTTLQRDLTKHNLALQRNKHTEIWLTISTTLHEHFKDDPREVVRAGAMDAEKIIAFIQQDHKKWFPYLSGPKMTNYWLYILTRYTDVPLTNRQAISIIPDTHVLQCSIKLGLTGETAGPTAVAEAWKNLLQGTSINPIDMHPILWNWSRNNFLPTV